MRSEYVVTYRYGHEIEGAVYADGEVTDARVDGTYWEDADAVLSGELTFETIAAALYEASGFTVAQHVAAYRRNNEEA